MLSKKRKKEIFDSITDQIGKSKALFLTNIIGVDSNGANDFRKKIRDAGGNVLVTRNTLLAKSAKGTGCEKLFESLKGPHAIAFAFEEPSAVAKVIHDASKDHELIELRGGMLDGNLLTAEEAVILAKLPSRDEMLATLLATFNAPVSAFVRVMEQVREQKASAEEA